MNIREKYKKIIYEKDLNWLKLDLNFNDQVNKKEFKQFTENFEDQKGQIGWRGLSYRGIDLKKVRPFTEYGNNNEDEVPYIWTEMSDKCPNLKKELNFAFPDSKFYRVKVNKLLPGGMIFPHSDSRKLGLGLTEHSPYTDPDPFKVKYITYALDWPNDVDFYVGKKLLPLKTGDIFMINFGMMHEVYNLGLQDRISVIITADLEDQEWWHELIVRSFQKYGENQPTKSMPFSQRISTLYQSLNQKIKARIST